MLNRTRELGDLVTSDFVASHSGPGVPPGRELVVRRDMTSGTYFSRISDEVGKPIRKKNGDCIPKPVKHWKVRVKSGPLLPWKLYYDESRGLLQDWEAVSTFVPVDWDFLSSPARLEAFCSTPPTSVLRDHALKSMYRFETQFPQEVSLPNFFWELREIGSLMSIIRERRYSWGYLEELPGDLMNWEFGWKPFLDDVGKLGKLFRTIEKRLDALRSTYGKVTRLGYKAVDVWQPDFSGAGSLIHPLISWRGLQTELRPSMVETELRVGALFYHEMPYLNDHIGRIRALIGALGLDNPLKVVWEAIPYSFVVDWFLNIGGTLATLGTFQDETIPWEIYNVNWSLKTKTTFDLMQVNNPETQPYFWDAKIGEVETTAYSRNTGYPEYGWLTANTSLTPRQAILMAAMIHG